MPAQASRGKRSCRTPLGTIRDPSIDAAGELLASRSPALADDPFGGSPESCPTWSHPRSARACRCRNCRSAATSIPALFARELDRLFQRGPRYVGHELAVPELGDYYALPQEGEGRALVRTPQRRAS